MKKEISLRYKEENECGFVSGFFDNDIHHYWGRRVPSNEFTFRYPLESIEKYFRYMRFCEKNNLRECRGYHPMQLKNKRPSYHTVLGFDHTTAFSRKGDRYPLVITTEPYPEINEEELKNWDSIKEKYGVEYQVYKKSSKSLHYPGYTEMVYWWNPKRLDFHKEISLPDDWEIVKKDLTYSTTHRKV